ncbi:hypothetical protein E7T06_05825 [Deinococcus sp. Arct2-2]|uniref:hypothetical protein n=1 Tax=Deinococcus sp. Arct2-2 TaxID=2568653 RepID=UPI0010A4FC0B|nr:hypothetical protein [Deinococcus sp. Arct2-2]THF70861.1 hypothetical protein E7T06_05825 [Deinococcus sp. Arct2-2]
MNNVKAVSIEPKRGRGTPGRHGFVQTQAFQTWLTVKAIEATPPHPFSSDPVFDRLQGEEDVPETACTETYER